MQNEAIKLIIDNIINIINIIIRAKFVREICAKYFSISLQSLKVFPSYKSFFLKNSSYSFVGSFLKAFSMILNTL